MPAVTSGWGVENQRPTTELDPATGKAVKGVSLAFYTPLGNHGEVFVPQQTYNRGPEAVREIVKAAVMNMDAIHKLAG